MKEKQTTYVNNNGSRIHSVCFADDTVIIADSTKEMKRMVEILSETREKLKLKIIENKTKTMVVEKGK